MTAIDECLAQAMAIPGAQGVTLVDYASGFPVAAVGADDLTDAAVDAAGTADLIRAILASPSLASAWTGDEIEEITVSGTAGYHLLILVNTAFDARLCLHLRLDRKRGNLALARHRLRAIVRELAAQ
jgi:predicted regulator of Ras-like GTPase activity (Roadblock/LC7/MglB family)